MADNQYQPYDPREKGVKDLLEKNLKLNQENNQMLHTIERHERWNRIMSWLYWIIIIGSALGLYYYFQPYIDSIRKLILALPGLESVIQSFKGGTPSH